MAIYKQKGQFQISETMNVGPIQYIYWMWNFCAFCGTGAIGTSKTCARLTLRDYTLP